MKNFLFLAMVLVAIASCASLRAVLGGGGAASGEIYEGTGQGYRGTIRVNVRFSGGSIVEIVVVDSLEDRFVGGAAIEELIDIVIEHNSTDVDVVSGATESSRGFLEAVESAIMLR